MLRPYPAKAVHCLLKAEFELARLGASISTQSLAGLALWPATMSESGKKAVFLSYASQDAEAASRICEAMRAEGIEVWFDRSELRGGDAWDQQIRRQIRSCGLFLPIISSNTQERQEGYFRREWKLAAERTRDMAAGTAFILPVAIDGTSDMDALVPEEFLQVQWERLPGGEPRSEFTERIRTLTVKSTRVPPPPASFLAPPKPRPLADQSVAVLAFSNLSDDRENEYFSDGISEELIHVLARLPHWRIAARTSAFYFKGRNVPISQIARELNVSHVVEGSVRKLGNRVRVAAQLIDAANGFQLWSKHFDRELKDIFALQDELANSIVEELRAALTGTAAHTPDGMIVAALQSHSAERTENPEAYRLYLQARYFLLRSNVDDNERSRKLFQEAIATDHDYASAWAGLSLTYSAAADLGILSFASGYCEARNAAERALALAPNLAEAQAALIKVTMSHDWDWPCARLALKQARALAPNNVDLLNCAVLLAKFTGAHEEAIGLGRQAVEIDPLNVQSRVRLAGVYFEAGQLTEAEREARRALELSPASDFALYYYFAICLFSGKIDEARRSANQEKDNEFRLFFEALLAVAQGEQDRANLLIRELEERSQATMAYQIASIYARRGESDAAFKWLDTAFEMRDPGMARIRNDPLLISLRHDSRWPALLKRMRLD